MRSNIDRTTNGIGDKSIPTTFKQKIPLSRLFYWTGACLVGLLAVGYAKLVELVQHTYFSWFAAHPMLVSSLTPFAFVAAAFLVVRFAPEAKGSGIPQVLEAIEITQHEGNVARPNPLVSIKTALVKVLSSCIGVLGGASIGREGPTIQIASSMYAWIGRFATKFGTKIDYASFLIGGAAAGVAAAFNTPLAGVTFALEEIVEGTFTPFKRKTILGVVIAGITAQALVGDYLYFGHPNIQTPAPSILVPAVVIGIFAGLCGGVFAYLLANPPRWLGSIQWWFKALVCGCLCAAFGFATHGSTAGSGYETTRHFMESDHGIIPIFFAPAKLLTTVLSYYSGMAGGIFSPSLSIGAGLGASIGQVLQFTDLKAAALMGMVAFFSGAIQAPLTGVIIVMEMTDEHKLIIPFMIAAFLAQRMGQLILPEPLYRYLANRSAASRSSVNDSPPH